jgi:hypothetical protein
MTITKDMLKQIMAANKSNGNNRSNNSENGNVNGNSQCQKCCVHCKCFHPHVPDKKCWNLLQDEANCYKGYVVHAKNNST